MVVEIFKERLQAVADEIMVVGDQDTHLWTTVRLHISLQRDGRIPGLLLEQS